MMQWRLRCHTESFANNGLRWEDSQIFWHRRDNVNDHRAAAIDLQAEKPARPAAPCASYCYHAFVVLETMLVICCCLLYTSPSPRD